MVPVMSPPAAAFAAAAPAFSGVRDVSAAASRNASMVPPARSRMRLVRSARDRISGYVVALMAGGCRRSGGAGWRGAGRLEETAIKRANRGDPQNRRLLSAGDLEPEDRLVNGGELAKRGECCEHAVLGVSTAAVGWIEVGNA